MIPSYAFLIFLQRYSLRQSPKQHTCRGRHRRDLKLLHCSVWDIYYIYLLWVCMCECSIHVEGRGKLTKKSLFSSYPVWVRGISHQAWQLSQLVKVFYTRTALPAYMLALRVHNYNTKELRHTHTYTHIPSREDHKMNHREKQIRLFISAVLRIEPRTSRMPGRCSARCVQSFDITTMSSTKFMPDTQATELQKIIFIMF